MQTSCKQCHGQVNKGVKTCPHCGANNPGYQGNWTNTFVYLGYVGVFFAIIYTVADFLGFVD